MYSCIPEHNSRVVPDEKIWGGGFEGKALYFCGWGVGDGGGSGVVAGLGSTFSIQLCVCVCVCVFKISSLKPTGPIEAKFHVEPPWDRGRKFIQMVQVIIVNLRGAGALLRGAGAGILPEMT